MSVHSLKILAVVLSAGWLAAAAGPARGDDFYLPPEHFGAARAAEFLTHAREYLSQNSQAENAPRVASDLLMMATLTGNQPLVEEARRGLLFRYPGSLYTAYFLAGLGQPQELRKTLQGALEDPQEFPDEFCRAFCAAVRAGGRRFGNALLADDDFLLECAVMAHGARDSQLLAGCRTLIGRGSGPSKETAAIVFDHGLDDTQRVMRLHALRKNKAARIAERFFHARLSAAEREQPQILKLAAESHLERRQFGDALVLLEKMPGDHDDSQVLFWRAWCLAALGRGDETAAVLDELTANHADDPWQALGTELRESREHLDDTLQQHAKVLAAAVDQLREDGPEVLELRCEVETSDGRRYDVYAGLDTARHHAEAIVSQRGDVIAAVRVSQRTARLFVKGEPAIYEFPSQGALPSLPSFQLTRAEDGSFRLTSVPAQPGLIGIQQTRSALLESPWLNTPGGLAELLQKVTAAGGVARAPVEDENGHMLVWLFPAIDRPEWRTFSMHVNREERIDGLETERLHDFQLRYGPAGALTLTEPDWPDLPVDPREKMEPALWFRVLASVMSLVSDQTEKSEP